MQEAKVTAVVAGTDEQLEVFASMLEQLAELTTGNSATQVSVDRVRILERQLSVEAIEDGTASPEGLLLDADVASVIGVRLDSSRPHLMVSRGKVGIKINDKELVKEGYHASGLFSSVAVPPDSRYKTSFGRVDAGNRAVTLRYEDADNPDASFQPYTVFVYFLVIMK